MKLNYRALSLTPASLSFKIVEADPARIAVEPHLVTDRRMGPLRTVHALANRAADSNGIELPPLCSLKVIGIDKITGVMHLAA